MTKDKIAKNLLAEHTCDSCYYGPNVENSYCVVFPEDETCECWKEDEKSESDFEDILNEQLILAGLKKAR